MKELVWILVSYALLAIESPLLGHLDSQFYAPDIALLTALYAGSRTPMLRAVATAFAIGLIKDGLATSVPIGLNTEIAVLIALTAQLLERRVDLRSPVPLMATAAALSLLSTGVFLALEAIFHRSFNSYGDVLRMALPLALITMLVAPVQFALLNRVTRRFEARERAGAIFLRR